MSIRNVLSSKKNLIYALTFLALLLLCYLFPYTHDDWAWGSSIGVDRLNIWFDGYGGRYLGYLIVMAMTRSHIVKAIMMAGVITGIGICIEKITGKRWAFLASILMIFLVAKNTFAQSIAWTSGFANYATSILLILIFLIYALKQLNKKACRDNVPMMMLLAVLGFCSALIVEHVTVCSVIIGFMMLAYIAIRDKKLSLSLLGYTVGAVVGAALMFSNSAYSNIASATDSYRGLFAGGLVSRMAGNYLENIYGFGLLLNVILVVMFFVVFVMFLALKKIATNKRLYSFCLVTYGIFVVYAILNMLLPMGTKHRLIIYAEGLCTAMAMIDIIAMSYIVAKNSDNSLKRTLMLMWVTCAVLVAPLFVITPIGSRCLFAPYVIMAVIWCLLASESAELFSKRAKKIAEKVGEIAMICACAGVYLYFLLIFGCNFYKDISRLTYIRKEVASGNSEVVLEKLPFDSFMQLSSPVNDVYKERFKLFYELPEDLEIICE